MTETVPNEPRRRSRWRIVSGILLTLAVSLGAWQFYNNQVLHHLGVVTEGQVYKSGAMPPAQMAAVAKKLGLRTVVDFRTYRPGQDSTNTTPLENIDAEREALAAEGIRHIHLPTPQVPSDATVGKFLAVMADPANRPILIHCYHGVGRTELFAALYRMEFEGWSNDKARNATRFFIPGSSFSDKAEKGRFLMGYHPHHSTGVRKLLPRDPVR